MADAKDQVMEKEVITESHSPYMVYVTEEGKSAPNAVRFRADTPMLELIKLVNYVHNWHGFLYETQNEDGSVTMSIPWEV